MSETRPGRAPLNPRDGGAHPADALSPADACAFQRPAPISHWFLPSARVKLTRHHRGFICIPPSGLPQPVAPGWNEGPWAVPSGFAPRSYPQRTLRRGQAPRTGPGPTPSTSSRTSPVTSTQLNRPRVATARTSSPAVLAPRRRPGGPTGPQRTAAPTPAQPRRGDRRATTGRNSPANWASANNSPSASRIRIARHPSGNAARATRAVPARIARLDRGHIVIVDRLWSLVRSAAHP